MATNTYVALDKVTLVSSASSITFSSIPQTYTDLRFVGSFNSSSYAVGGLQYNGVTSGYSTTFNYGATSSRTTAQGKIPFQQGFGPITEANSFQIVNVDIMNYANTTTKKTTLWKTGNPTSTGFPGYEWGIGLYPSTSAITSITFDAGGANIFQSGSTFSLYGIKADANTAYATGGTITYDAGYFYHTFTSSGTFTPSQALTADYLVVAGGGGGGGGSAGGGGAGGLRSTVSSTGGGGSLETALSLTPQAYTVTIGAGGTKGSGFASGSNGDNSVFSTITSTGGGAGGTNSNAGGAGGSGGGAGGASGSQFLGGTGTANQGFAGGTTPAAGSVNSAGGGGGAGGVGGGSLTAQAGNGGSSVNNSISGTSTAYAGGGGGGRFDLGGQGTGGGGGATAGGSNTNATANTGSGGGGSNQNSSTGGNGGSGIVIVRYAR